MHSCSEIVLVVVLVASKIVRKANEQAKINIIVFLYDQVFIWQSSLEDDSIFFLRHPVVLCKSWKKSHS